MHEKATNVILTLINEKRITGKELNVLLEEIYGPFYVQRDEYATRRPRRNEVVEQAPISGGLLQQFERDRPIPYEPFTIDTLNEVLNSQLAQTNAYSTYWITNNAMLNSIF